MTRNRITSLLSIPCHRIIDGHTQYGLLDCQESKLRFHKRETGEESIPIYKIESADINEEGGVLKLTFLSRFGLLTFYCDSNISKERATRLVHAIQGEIDQYRKASYRTTPFYKVETQAQVDDWKPDTCRVEVYKQEMFIYTPDREYRIPATSIKELQWRSIFRALVLSWQTEEGTLRALFYGLVARKLHAYLRALQDGSIRGHWTGSLKSTLQWDVLLVSSSKSLYITTLSPISILFSSLTQRIPFETISMAKYGIRGLHLQSLAGHHYHFIPHKSPLFNARRICQHFARFGRTYAKESVSTAYRWLPTREIHRGILHIEEKQLRFSYHQREREDDCWNYQQLSRDDDGDSNKEFLSLRAGVESIRIQPSKGVPFLEYFHEKTKLPHHRLYWQELSANAKKRIVHNAVAHIHSNRLNQNLMAKLLFISGKIVVQPLSSSKVTQFTDVSVEFNTPTGRYMFQSYISPTQSGIFLSPPHEITLSSQRSTARIPVEGSLSLLALYFDQTTQNWKSTNESNIFSLHDISEKGCGIIGQKEVEVGTRVLIELSPFEKTPQIFCEVVYCILHDATSFHIGLRFLNVPSTIRSQISEFLQTSLSSQYLE